MGTVLDKLKEWLKQQDAGMTGQTEEQLKQAHISQGRHEALQIIQRFILELENEDSVSEEPPAEEPTEDAQEG